LWFFEYLKIGCMYLDNFLFIWKVWSGAMFVTISYFGIMITAFSIIIKPMKNRKKTGPNHGNTNPHHCLTGHMSSKSTLMAIKGWNRSKPGATPPRALNNVADTSSSYESHKINNFEVIQHFHDNPLTRLQTRSKPIQYFWNHSPCARLLPAWGFVVL
jgi:hypothetical protein